MATATATAQDLIPLHIDGAPAPPPRRPRVLLVGASLAAAGSVAVFAALFGAYLSIRSDVLASGGSWLPDGATIPLSPGNMGMITLIMSVVTVQWAVHAGHRADRPHAYIALGLTLLLGLAHVVQMAYLWTQWNLPLNGSPTIQGVLLFTILGLHVAMVTGALIFLALMTLRSLGGQFTGYDAEGLSAAALYWYVTVAVFTVPWYAILITK